MTYPCQVDTYSYASTPQLDGEHTQAVWAISGDDPAKVSAHQVAQRMNIRMTQPHLVWNPVDGELVEMVPATHENRWSFGGRRAFTILVVSTMDPIFTDYPEQHLLELFTRVPEEIPSDWPMGPPSTLDLVANKSPRTAPGHYTANQYLLPRDGVTPIPVGGIDIKRLRRPE